jgi:hypothetical protein
MAASLCRLDQPDGERDERGGDEQSAPEIGPLRPLERVPKTTDEIDRPAGC